MHSEREQGRTMRLGDIGLAAIAARVSPEGTVAEARIEVAHLGDRRARVGPWVEALAAARERPDEADSGLWKLAEALGLEEPEVLAVALAAEVERDDLAGRAIAWAQRPLGGSRPTLGLLARALRKLTDDRPELALRALVGGAARRSGLIRLAPETAPMPERFVVLSEPVSAALQGFDSEVPGVELGSPEAPIPLSDTARVELARHARALRQTPRAGLVVRTPSRLEGRAVAHGIAAELALEPCFIDGTPPAGLGPWALLRGLLPVLRMEPGPGEVLRLPRPEGYSGPILVLCGIEGNVDSSHWTLVSWTVPIPAPAERVALWLEATGSPELAHVQGHEHRHSAGRIAHLGRAVRYLAASEGRRRPGREDVVEAAWSGEGAGLDALAVPLKDPVPDDAMVLSKALEQEMDDLLERCRARDGLDEGLGAAMQTRYRPGVKVLFVGPSGTGKTLAAGWLATRLSVPIYRVDLAGVMSKYIGETEKNLSQLLARAERSDLILLFDEADSLFGRRTEVRQANDRFANTQTNYLLQRIETFDGVAILTSNSRARFDSAFTRRLDTIVEFNLPAPADRRRIWLAHLGDSHAVRRRDLSRLAAAAELAGGHIRSVVLAAAVRARAARRPIEGADLLEALSAEYRKLGRPMPASLGSPGGAR